MYANGILVDEYPLYQQKGILKNTPYTSVNEINESNKIQAGQEVFNLTCSRCHTTHGINSVVVKFENMYGKEKSLDVVSMKAYMKGMHNVRYFMPPFPGNDDELDALAWYIQHQQQEPRMLEGVQIKGIDVKDINY
jgi:mono/diheme cytochrome c family protein